MENINIRVITGFDDPLLNTQTWEQLIDDNDIKHVFLTKAWLSTWWDSFGQGKLLLVVALKNGMPIALAPLFADSGMIYFVGSGGSDYLDFIGDTNALKILQAMLEAARKETPEFIGFRFYHVPGQSKTGEKLKSISSDMNLKFYNEGGMAAPALDLKKNFEPILNKKSLKRHHNYFARAGALTVRHLYNEEDIQPLSNIFFQQHINRWEITPYPSLFKVPLQCTFYNHLVKTGSKAGWLRFTAIYWHETPIAFHLGFSYRGNYLWYKPSFEIALAKHSPGEVLIRELLIAAKEENAEVFDFGLGDEAFKSRFANRIEHVITFGMYPPEVIDHKKLLEEH